jgi:hypothetical protein
LAGCGNPTPPCNGNNIGTTTAGQTIRAIAPYGFGANPGAAFTAIHDGFTSGDVYLSNGMTATKLATGVALEDLGPFDAPAQIAVDADCVYAIRRTPAGRGPAPRQIICIRHQLNPVGGEKPIEILANVGDARGLAVLRNGAPGGRGITLFWGERQASSPMGGAVMCLSRTIEDMPTRTAR